MDTVRLNHIVLNGPGLWKILHKMAVNPENKSIFPFFLLTFRECINCPTCLLEFDNFLKNNPLENYNNIIVDGRDIGFFKWTWQLHNIVNSKLKKPIPSLTEAYKNNECVACIKLD